MQENKPFSIHARARSFIHAFKGLWVFFRNEHNAWIHLLGSIVVIVMGFVFRVSPYEWIALVFAIGFVWVAELFNTAIEKIMDFISPGQDQRIRVIKDLAAAVVLIAAITALITGSIIFIPKF